MRRTAPRRLVSIQYLRAAAALAVVVYHALQWRSGGFDVGRAGVDVFFVISGLVLWGSAAGRRRSPAGFLAARARRILPSYWFVTLAVAAAAAIWPAFLPQVRPGGVHLLLSLGLIPHLDPRGMPFPTLPPGWSLCYEAIFYIVFAVALALPLRWRAPALVGGLCAITAAGFILADPVYVLGANPLLLEFAAGVGLGVLVEHDRLPAWPWAWAMLFAGLSGLALTQTPGGFVELWRPLLWGVPAVLVVGGAVALEAPQLAPRSTAGVAVGDASYALYLVHLPTVALAAHLLAAAPLWIFLPCAVAGSTIVALSYHRWVERPFDRWLRSSAIDFAYRGHEINRLDGAGAAR